jgi:hypothetical protein
MNNRIIGIIGAVLLIVGIFLPIVSIAGVISVSGFTVVTTAPISDSWPIILLILCGIGGLLLALTNNYRALIAPGFIALAVVVYGFIRMKSSMGGASDATGADAELAQQMASSVSIGIGVYVMAAGAIVMIVAGVLKNKVAVASAGYGAPPPPPYTPGR